MDELTSVLVFLAICGALGGGTWLSHLSHLLYERRHRIRSTWWLAAEQLGATVERGRRGGAESTDVRLFARFDGRHVTASVEREELSARRPPMVVTRVGAAATGATGLQLRVSPEQGWAALGKLLGGHDVVVGDAPFDDAYVIEASNEDLARAWLGEPVRRAIEACAPYRIDLVDGEVRATHQGIEDRADRLRAVVENVARCAGAGDALLEDARALASKIDGLLSLRSDRWAPDGGALIAVERAGSRILVDWATRAAGRGVERIVTRLRARVPDMTAVRFVLRGDAAELGDPPEDLAGLPAVPQGDGGPAFPFELFSDAGAEMLDRLSASLRRRVVELSPALVASDGREVMVLLAGVVLDSRPILGAVELALELAAIEPSRPYR